MIDEALEKANFWESLKEGFVAGGVVSLASTVAQSGLARFLATKGISQAAKAAGPAGAILSGAVSFYALTQRGWGGIGQALTFTGWNAGEGDELWANRFHAIAEFLDVLGNVADVIAGVAGIVAVGGTLIGLIPGMQWVLPAVPIAAKVAFWGGIVGLACALLKAAAQYVSRKFRENHLLHMDLENEAALETQQQAITDTARATYNFLGGMAGAGTVAVGARGTRATGEAYAASKAQVQGRPSLAGPLEPVAVHARQTRTPKQLDTARAIDDAWSGVGPPRTRDPEAVQSRRGETDAAIRNAEEASGRHGQATRDLDAATTRTEQAAAQTRRAGEAESTARQNAEAAARNSQETTARALAEAESPTSRGRQLSEAADQRSRQAAEYDRRAAAAEPHLDRAKSQRDATETARQRKQAEVDEAAATEAAAMAQYEGMERGQMALAIARDARRRGQAARTELDQIEARLRDQQAEVSRLEVEYGTARDLANAQRRQAADLHGQAAAEAQHRAQEIADARQAWEAAEQGAARARDNFNESARLREQAQTTQRERAQAARETDTALARADTRLQDAHAAEVATTAQQGSRQQSGLGAAATSVAETGGGGGAAQNILNTGSVGTEGANQCVIQRTPDDAEPQEIAIPVEYQAPPAPTSSAEIDELNVTATSLGTVAGQAGTQQAEAETEAEGRRTDGEELERMKDEVQEGSDAAEETKEELDDKDSKRTTLEGNTTEISGKMGDFGDKMGDLSTFARFVARILGYASGLTHPRMPGRVQNAGRRITQTGRTIEQTVSGTQSGLAERSSAEGPEQARLASERAALEASRGAMPETAADLDASTEQVEEMIGGNEERESVASESATTNADMAARARARAAATTSEGAAKQAALDAWAAQARATRQEAIEQTRQRLEQQGYEITNVTGA